MAEVPEWLSIPEAARFVGVKDCVLLSLLDDGRLPCTLFENGPHIDRAFVQRTHHLTRISGAFVLSKMDPLSQAVLERLAQRYGRHLINEPSAEAILDLVEADKAALVVLDGQAEELDCALCYAQIRALRPDLPVLIACAPGDGRDYSEHLFGGPVFLIQRPILIHHMAMFMTQVGFPKPPLRSER